jgi:hypothetical protein
MLANICILCDSPPSICRRKILCNFPTHREGRATFNGAPNKEVKKPKTASTGIVPLVLRGDMHLVVVKRHAASVWVVKDVVAELSLIVLLLAKLANV